MTRHHALKGFGLVCAVALLPQPARAAEPVPVPPKPVVTRSASTPKPAEAHRRADLALQSLLLRFWDGGAGNFNSVFPANGRHTGYWTYAQTFDVVMDGVERTGGRRYAGWIQTLFEAQDRRNWNPDFYDDEMWMALALLRAHAFTHKPAYLTRALALHDDIAAAWDETCCGDRPGGIWWDRRHTQKATASNAGPVILAARLYRVTRDRKYLDFAEKAYRYWKAEMTEPDTGAVGDHIEPDGAKVWWRFTYNEGLMVGAATELYRVTKRAEYLADARRYAHFMVTTQVTPTPDGPVLFDGPNERCSGDCQQFKEPAYRYLDDLNRVSPQPEVAAVLNASVKSLWSRARNPETNHFATNWAGPPPATGSLASQNSATAALNLWATPRKPLLSSPFPHAYEAEDATLEGLGVEAAFPGFSGWGYVGAWNRDGQSVTFTVRNPLAGARRLRFRYATGTGVAIRSLRVNGMFAGMVTFSATGTWNGYATLDAPMTLPAGRVSVTLAYETGMGGAGYLNLDRLEALDAAGKPRESPSSIPPSTRKSGRESPPVKRLLRQPLGGRTV